MATPPNGSRNSIWPVARRRRSRRSRREFLDEQALLGPPARIRERYQAWADSYITGLTVRTNQPEAIELMADLAKESSGA